MGIEYTPADPVSGLPLLIAPDNRALLLYQTYKKAVIDPGTGHSLADWNHNFHPAAEVIAGGAGATALRSARVQYVLRPTHDEYHNAFWGPRPLTKPAERFKAVMLCAANYIPPQAMRFASGGVQIYHLAPAERQRLQTTGEVKVASLSVVQKFIKDYVLAQPVDHIKMNAVDEFLSLDPSDSVDAAKRYRYLTHLLLSLVIDRVEDELMQPYRYGYRHDLLSPAVPRRPDAFVHWILTPNKKYVSSIACKLGDRLRAYRDGPNASLYAGGLAVGATA